MAKQETAKAIADTMPDHQTIDITARRIGHTADFEIRAMNQVYDGLSVIHELMFDFVGSSVPEHNLNDGQAERLVQAANGLVTLLAHSITEVEGALESAGSILAALDRSQ
ncbi:MAG: hypothetical protein R6X15_05275 [Pseudomonadota bacterium]